MDIFEKTTKIGICNAPRSIAIYFLLSLFFALTFLLSVIFDKIKSSTQIEINCALVSCGDCHDMKFYRCHWKKGIEHYIISVISRFLHSNALLSFFDGATHKKTFAITEKQNLNKKLITISLALASFTFIYGWWLPLIQNSTPDHKTSEWRENFHSYDAMHMSSPTFMFSFSNDQKKTSLPAACENKKVSAFCKLQKKN